MIYKSYHIKTSSNFVIFIFIIAIIFVSCSYNKHEQQNKADNQFNDKERLESINKYLTEKDKDIIESYIRRQGWKMKFSPDGYFYEIYDEGTPPKALNKNKVEYEYVISLLNGTICYKSTEPKEFIVGGSEEISGMHLAVKRLGKGGRAKFIFPPQMAYGLQGDMNKIPLRAIVMYDINVVNIK
jgi:FKBP-type peptidyl-prolyl cis-trans isomerase